MGKLTELFPDREGPDDPSLLTNLDDATMNSLLKNLIAKLSNKDFPGYGEGDGCARKELAKNARRHRSRKRPTRRKKPQRHQDPSSMRCSTNRRRRSTMLTNADLRDLAHRQDVLKERTEELHEKLESLFQLFPQLDPKIVQSIGEAGQSMGSAQNRLGQLDSRGAVPPEQAALDRLSQSQQQMQSSMQQMAQRGQLGNMPITRLFRQGGFHALWLDDAACPACRNFPSSISKMVSAAWTPKNFICREKTNTKHRAISAKKSSTRSSKAYRPR